ncbi:MAG: 4-hydroxy-tetrahydrodipicolinate reductase [Azospirillum sp.]|nr:4-hydroxy-tetrahydrodipicolinate reductase [Azospirillum sp.]
MKITVTGCAGRMGQMVVRQVVATAGCSLVAGTERPGSAVLGRDVGTLAGLEPLGVLVTDDVGRAFAAAEAVIDFTSPAAAELHAATAAAEGSALVIGTTGLATAQQRALAEAARHVAVIQAPNMSLGVNLLIGLVEQVAQRLGEEFDIEVLEMHHKHKVDAPSGTALALGRAAAAGREADEAERAVRVRDGHTGPRVPGTIGYAVLRGGDVIGDHSVIFAGDGERIELTHRASGRQIYAVGAVRAALWTRDRPPGLYGMRNVLGV